MLLTLTVEPIEGSERTVYRAVSVSTSDDDRLLASYLSSSALGRPPRPGSPESRFNLIHQGISCFYEHRHASQVAAKYSLGPYIAEICLRPNEGVTLAAWGRRGHVTVWADPVKLVAMTVDISRMETIS